MVSKIFNKISFRENKRRYLNLKGIFSRRFAYKGPDVVQIDLTDRCNSHCLICWTHSPFVKEDENKKDLDPILVKNFISDIAKSGTKEIIFSGGGEPFLYADIWGILEFTEKLGLAFRINTNLILLNRNDINRLLSLSNLLSLTVSVWAGDADLYLRLHNRDRDTFLKFKNNLKFLNISKFYKPNVIAYAVINNMNYLGLRSLIELCTDTGCDVIEFGIPDLIPGVTDSFLLSNVQLNLLKQDFIKILRNLDGKNRGIKIINKNIFLRRISNHKACYGEYDSSIERVPCYAGWTFLRLKANGDFNSCLKSHRIPIGNIYKDSFFSVWNGSLQQEFREKGLSITKDKEYFKVIGNSFADDIGCKRVCDNILTNEHLYKIIRFLSWV